MEVNGQDVTDDRDCPVLMLSDSLLTVKSETILKPVSIVHECGRSCILRMMRKSRRAEREEQELNSLALKHDYKNNKMFVLNIYCMKYT